MNYPRIPYGSRRWCAVLAAVASWALSAPAAASAWEYETYHAEAKSLPCAYDALMGFWQPHTSEYHKARIEAFDYALAWAPYWTDALDVKGLSLMRLSSLKEAEQALRLRLTVAPDAYASHANLGILYTWSGENGRAIEHIDRALKIEPNAQFGREQYYRKLVVFLGRLAADYRVGEHENFLGLDLSDEDRVRGSKQKFEARGFGDDAIDSLVAMITVYGADRMGEVYLTLGELLALRGHPRLAWIAYKRAEELHHVRSGDLARWSGRLLAERAIGLRARTKPISEEYPREADSARQMRQEYATWERAEIKNGLPVWSEEGLDAVYAKMNSLRRRCKAPAVIDDPLAPDADKGRTP